MNQFQMLQNYKVLEEITSSTKKGHNIKKESMNYMEYGDMKSTKASFIIFSQVDKHSSVQFTASSSDYKSHMYLDN